jgi:hypothetical protein
VGGGVGSGGGNRARLGLAVLDGVLPLLALFVRVGGKVVVVARAGLYDEAVLAQGLDVGHRQASAFAQAQHQHGVPVLEQPLMMMYTHHHRHHHDVTTLMSLKRERDSRA